MTIRDRFEVSLPRVAVVAHDLCMVWLSWYGLHRFRYAIQPMSGPLPAMSMEMLLVLCAQGLVFWRVGLYRGVWRFASLPDLVNIMKAALFGLLAIVIVLFFYNRLDMVPRTVLVLYPVVLSALLGMPRLLYRSWKDTTQKRGGRATVRVLIIGAGEAGETLVRDLRRAGTYQPVGFLDDAARLHGSNCRDCRSSAASRTWSGSRRKWQRNWRSSPCRNSMPRRCGPWSRPARSRACHSAWCRGWTMSWPGVRDQAN